MSLSLNDIGIELIERGMVDALQLYYSIVDFEAENKILPLAKKNHIGIIASEPLAQGFLTGKYKKNFVFPQEDLRRNIPKSEIIKRCTISKKLENISNESMSISQIALSYVLHREEVSTCIPSAKTIQQLVSNCNAAKIELTEKEISKIRYIQEEMQ